MRQKVLPLSSSLFLLFLLSLTGCSSSEDELLINPSTEVYLPAGRSLVQGLAACGHCHGSSPTPRSALSGGQILTDVYGKVLTPNLVSPELKGWKVSELVTAIRKSERPDEVAFAAEHHLGYEWMSDEDAFAIAAYLRSLPRVDNTFEKRDLSTFDKYTSGFMEQRRSVSGYVPPIPRRDRKAYGKYLVDHIARCGSCHDAPATLFTEAQYLKGGKEIQRAEKSYIAPNITGSETFGIGEWGEDEIVAYLSTGKPPGSAFKQSEACPTDFYGLAPREDLQAIARYLRSVENT